MGIIGSAFVGYNRVYGVGENRPQSPSDISGLVFKFEANSTDYTQVGSLGTWDDSSGNNNDLTFYGAGTSATILDTTLGYDAVKVNGSVTRGITSAVSDWTSTTEITNIEIIRPILSGYLRGTFGLQGTNNVSMMPPTFQSNNHIGVLRDSSPDTGAFWGLGTPEYDTSKTSFIARRIDTGFNNSSGLDISYGNDDGTSLTHYGPGDFVRDTEMATGVSTYSLGSSTYFALANYKDVSSAARCWSGYYMASLTYNRVLTDNEIQVIYDYYKTTYSLA